MPGSEWLRPRRVPRNAMVGAGTPAASVPGRLLDTGLAQLVRLGLRGVWVRGDLPPSAAIWAANHHSWWDAFVAAAVLRERQRPAALLMDEDNLDAFRFVRSAGVIYAQYTLNVTTDLFLSTTSLFQVSVVALAGGASRKARPRRRR